MFNNLKCPCYNSNNGIYYILKSTALQLTKQIFVQIKTKENTYYAIKKNVGTSGSHLRFVGPWADILVDYRGNFFF